MIYHKNRPFSTKDADHDSRGGSTPNCAINYHGAWWYGGCEHSNLNGDYAEEQGKTLQGIHWRYWRGSNYCLKAVDMKMRPAGFTPGEESNMLVIYSRLAVPSSVTIPR